MRPISAAGVFLISQMAMLSHRAEKASEQEAAAIAMNVRHATDAFDESRIEAAEELFKALADDPKNNLRKLKKSPEGIEILIEGWRDLRADLTMSRSPGWTIAQLELAAILTGLKLRHALDSRLGALSQALRGDFSGLGEFDGGGLDESFRKEWAKAELLDRIDAEIAALEVHYQTLDFAMIELDRAEAGSRALFNASKSATLARRYEAEARRGFFKALKEFRLVEAEALARLEVAPTPPTAPPTSPADPRMGSSRENPSTPDREPIPVAPVTPSSQIPVVQTPVSQPSTVDRPAKTPG